MTWHAHLNAGNSALARRLFDEAENQFRKALQEARKLSVVDPEITDVLRQLSLLALQRGNAEEALAFAREACDIDQGYWFGPSSQVCQDLCLAASAEDRLGLFQDAAETYFRAIHQHEQFYGSEHHETFVVRAMLLIALLHGPDSPRLDSVASRVLVHFSAICAPGTVSSTLGIDRRLQLLMSANREQDAEQYFKHSMAVLRKHLGDHNREVVTLQKSYAAMLANANKQLSAWRLKTTAETQTKKEDLAGRADDLILRGRFDEAEPLLRRHLTFMQMKFGPSHPSTLAVRKKYATVVQKAGAYSNATLRERALEVISRMAASGGAWKTACADAMRIHKIGNAEVEAQLHQWKTAQPQFSPPQEQQCASGSEYGSAVRHLQTVSRGGFTPWPAPQDYNEAVQNPHLCFTDAELRSGTPEVNALGLPFVASGAFASVYKFNCGSSARAVRCFLSPVNDREYRYQQLSDYICSDDLVYTVNFEYQSNGIQALSTQVPILKMEWVEGMALNLFIDEFLVSQGEMANLLHLFRRMTQSLHDAGVAHGDLQHGNILVRDNELVLVDYDGMFVPSLAGHQSNELGHPNYQHPGRNALHFGPYLDAFSSWVIDTSLFALTVDPSLWYSLKGGDECLLFRKADFLDPDKSAAMNTLLNHSCDELVQRVRYTLGLLSQPVALLPGVSIKGEPLLRPREGFQAPI
ncbi:MAG: hypothetical protein K2W95_02705 [Candidatus Obscuribacterales bacterium]|nr:hypothetical protein [Candidatus Obscuribacterales bacterium]